MIENKKKCKICRCLKDFTNFSIQRTGKVNLNCNDCIARVRANQEVHKCPHGRQKSKCKECKGVSICEHGRQKYRCKECNGNGICKHEKEKCRCKVCSDPIKVTIRAWISNARKSDKMSNRFDPDRFIDSDFCRGLIEDYPRCFYPDCKVEMQFIDNRDDLCTIERLDNSIGHIKSNCVLCCRKCNNARKSDNLEIEYSHHHYKAS